MKVCAAQLRPVAGGIVTNTSRHLELAVANRFELVFFPELSLTGYEPLLAMPFAGRAADPVLDGFQQCSDEHEMMIGVGLPTVVGLGVRCLRKWTANPRESLCWT